MTQSPPLEPSRALNDLRALRQLTEDDHGAQRVAWTDTWGRAREWLRGKLAELPVTVETDAAGNVWATLHGGSEKTLVIGSHIDSVPNGGWLDGSLGVLAGLEVLRRLSAAGTPPVTVTLVDWADEEGARFGRSLLGSGLAAGTIRPEELTNVRDADGIALADALREHGVDLHAAPRSGRRLESAAAYLELHIEQGPVLERSALPLGVVTGTAGVERHRVSLIGQAVQAGAFPMDLRRDPLLAAARLVLEVRAAALDEGSRSTVGDLRVSPGIPTAVPGECRLVIDQRHPEAGALAEMWRRTQEAAERIARAGGVALESERIWHVDPVAFDDGLIALAEETVTELAGSSVRLFSGALHDAAAVAIAGVPTVMLFVRSIGGISHDPREDSAPGDIELAVRALDRLATRVIERLAAG